MNRVLLVIAIVGLLVSPAAARKWTYRDGRIISADADVVEIKGGLVVLKQIDDTSITVPLSRLSLADIRYIQQVLKLGVDVTDGSERSGAAAEELQVLSKSDIEAVLVHLASGDDARIRKALELLAMLCRLGPIATWPKRSKSCSSRARMSGGDGMRRRC